ncbi:hypothetical protein HPB48_008966 [Haemaphysalis longicornis]|uniref:Peptidase M13 N-terminal domain-containing protein n=1 Tax=Haemaphysalis longicornis TaxID=44386 RepID=A0A9J6G2R7_HAELO|nr:hypothetical protein HPB48_008966 [Haemaphysalis longicornis]
MHLGWSALAYSYKYPFNGHSLSQAEANPSVRDCDDSYAIPGLLALALLLAGLCLVVAVRLLLYQTNVTTESTCGTQSCLTLPEIPAHSVDNDTAPCKNFYQYVCGRWTKSHNMSVEDLALKTIVSEAVKVLKIPVDLQSHYNHKPVNFFRTCTSVLSSSNVPGLRRILAEGGITWPDLNPTPDFLNALFFMSLRLFMPVIYTVQFRPPFLYFVPVFQSQYVKEFPAELRILRELIKTRRINNHLRTTYEAFTPVDESRLAEIVEHFENAQAFFNDNIGDFRDIIYPDKSAFLRYTEPVHKSRWDFLLRKYLNTTFNGVHFIIVSRKYFLALFELYKTKGRSRSVTTWRQFVFYVSFITQALSFFKAYTEAVRLQSRL